MRHAQVLERGLAVLPEPGQAVRQVQPDLHRQLGGRDAPGRARAEAPSLVAPSGFRRRSRTADRLEDLFGRLVRQRLQHGDGVGHLPRGEQHRAHPPPGLDGGGPGALALQPDRGLRIGADGGGVVPGLGGDVPQQPVQRRHLLRTQSPGTPRPGPPAARRPPPRSASVRPAPGPAAAALDACARAIPSRRRSPARAAPPPRRPPARRASRRTRRTARARARRAPACRTPSRARSGPTTPP